MLPIPIIFGIIAGLDRALSLIPFSGKKTKLGLALKAVVTLFPGLGQFLTPDVVDALDVLANALIGVGAFHGIIKDEHLKLRASPKLRARRR